ncbi:uncharacterized protein LOC141697998 [Apium graveolens]|uniref:uncharacterized protein LOC141697998 n=1 Tax=Apium graveolens TaxID=4045 RepID=UPI003D7A3651
MPPRRDPFHINPAQLTEMIGQAVNENGQGHQLEPFVWLGRFVKQKPDSFTASPTPIDAENWIVHLEKIFNELGCDEIQKVRLAVYKLEGGAQRWWRGVKATKGEQYAEALEWQGFKEHHDESITDYMARFIRLGGFVGTVAGTAAQQADKFKWEVADAAKDVEKERIDFRTSRSNSGSKRTRDDQGFAQGRQWYEDHSGRACYRQTGACFLCGSMSHRAKDCTVSRNTGGGGAGGGSGSQQNPTARVFALTANQEAANSGTISGTLLAGRRDAYVLFDTGLTHSVVTLSFVRHLGIAPSLLYPHMSIATPMGNSVIISDIYPEFPIVVEDIIIRLTCF